LASRKFNVGADWLRDDAAKEMIANEVGEFQDCLDFQV
jgi:hypothetical protein